MSHIFHRDTRADLPLAVRGDGVYIYDDHGNAYLDASGGAAVSCLGHSHPKVRQAIKEQADKIAFAHTGFFSNEPMEELADRLIGDAPSTLDRVMFLSGGSEAIEAAIKLSRQYFLETGQPHRRHIIARRQSYHGNTLGALSAGGNMWRREPFKPVLIESHHIAPCFAYREQQDGENEAEYGRRAADELETKIQALGPDTVMAFLAEPVVGATIGAVPAVPGYFRRIREICDKYGVLLILDEVMCGTGRTGTLFACEQDGIAPDLLVCAKGLGAGYQPIGALLISAAIYGAVHDGSGVLQHGHTYMGHAMACAAALAVQEAITDENLLSNVNHMGDLLVDALQERFGNHHHVGDLRGRGLFRGIELVADRPSKTPFDPARNINGRVKTEAMARGLVCYPGGGTVDGKHGDHVLLAPPFIFEPKHVEELVEKLDGAIDAAIRSSAPS